MSEREKEEKNTVSVKGKETGNRRRIERRMMRKREGERGGDREKRGREKESARGLCRRRNKSRYKYNKDNFTHRHVIINCRTCKKMWIK